MKHIYYLFLLGFSLGSTLHAQELFMVYLTPKVHANEYLQTPSLFLSAAALERKQHRSVILNETDVPIDDKYINTLQLNFPGYVGHSKWLNAAMIELNDSIEINHLNQLPFVAHLETLIQDRNAQPYNYPLKNKIVMPIGRSSPFNYGHSADYIKEINLHHLHNQGFLGENINIAIIDTGFPMVNSLEPFAHIYEDNRLIDTYNFVTKSGNVYTGASHGTSVLSFIAAQKINEYVGTAPKANFLLYASETTDYESPKELMFWAQAIERADSVGVDVVNTSLGYTKFDDPRYNYSYHQLDGKTTLISKVADIATKKGFLLVVASGNEGNKPWQRITAPADVKQVITVGSNNRDKQPSVFSSYGPAANGELKPNVSARGDVVPFYLGTGSVAYSSGTSFSSPIISGSMALLIQAFPNIPLDELRGLIQENSHLFPNSNNQLGYGIPDFFKIYTTLSLSTASQPAINEQYAYPNPFKEQISFLNSVDFKQVEVRTMLGKSIVKQFSNESISTIYWPSGVYIVTFTKANGETFSQKMIK